MSKCVYCLKTELETTFDSREHVISQFLGGFEPQNPNIKGNLICDNCNSLVFSQLEMNFKEDSYEGLFAQMLNLEDSGSVRIRGRNIDITTVSGFGDKFFDEIFPFLRYEDDNLVVDFKPQIKINNYANGYQIFTSAALQKIKSGGQSKFNKVKQRFEMKKKTEMAIFAGSEDGTTAEFEEFIGLLKDFGVNYNEKERKYIPNEDLGSKKFEVDVICEINSDLMRFIAKLAFNYFIYCAQQEGEFYSDLLYGGHFDQTRNFIYNNSGKWKDIVKLTNAPTILSIEGDGEKRIIAHTIYFTLNEDIIMARLSLFGKWIYEVKIGKYPLKLVNPQFGCGHVFEPFSGTIHPISPIPNSQGRFVDKGYGWFKIY